MGSERPGPDEVQVVDSDGNVKWVKYDTYVGKRKLPDKKAVHPVYFIDLDGTLYDDRWRRYLIDDGSQDPWAKYHAASSKDTRMNPWVVDLIRQLLRKGVFFFILTGRPSKYYHATSRKLCYDIPEMKLPEEEDGKMKWGYLSRTYKDEDMPTADWKLEMMQRNTKSDEYFILVDNEPANCDKAIEAGGQAVLIQWEGREEEDHTLSQVTRDFFRPIMQIHSERHESYGKNYLQFGKLLKHLTGDQDIHLETEKDWNRMALATHIMTKLLRYFSRWERGGHEDSLDDIAVYALLLKEIDQMEEE